MWNVENKALPVPVFKLRFLGGFLALERFWQGEQDTLFINSKATTRAFPSLSLGRFLPFYKPSDFQFEKP